MRVEQDHVRILGSIGRNRYYHHLENELVAEISATCGCESEIKTTSLRRSRERFLENQQCPKAGPPVSGSNISFSVWTVVYAVANTPNTASAISAAFSFLVRAQAL